MGSDQVGRGVTCFLPISIHAPRMGSDMTQILTVSLPAIFQSTLPAWGATKENEISTTPKRISIHAPRMGSDYALIWNEWFRDEFQSTLPAWGATFVDD